MFQIYQQPPTLLSSTLTLADSMIDMWGKIKLLIAFHESSQNLPILAKSFQGDRQTDGRTKFNAAFAKSASPSLTNPVQDLFSHKHHHSKPHIRSSHIAAIDKYSPPTQVSRQQLPVAWVDSNARSSSSPTLLSTLLLKFGHSRTPQFLINSNQSPQFLQTLATPPPRSRFRNQEKTPTQPKQRSVEPNFTLSPPTLCLALSAHLLDSPSSFEKATNPKVCNKAALCKLEGRPPWTGGDPLH